jgi:oxidase EvaA
VAADGLRATNGGAFDVRCYHVQVRGREVRTWDQPFVQSHGVGRVVLPCAVADGVLKLLFVPRAEVGLAAGVELTPALCVEPGPADARTSADADATAAEAWWQAAGQTLLASRQSEEGGRFFRDENVYRLAFLPDGPAAAADAPALPPDAVWLSLQAVQRLARVPHVFTNEARSAVSLLLTYL